MHQGVPIILVAIVSLLLGASAPGSTLAEEDAGAGASANGADERLSPEALSEAMRFRTEFGFAADAPYVLMAAADSEGFPDMQWGVPLSVAEADEMTRRTILRHSLGPAMEHAASRPDYSGFYVDQLDQGAPVFLFVQPDDDIETQLRELLPPGATFRVEARSRPRPIWKHYATKSRRIATTGSRGEHTSSCSVLIRLGIACASASSMLMTRLYRRSR